MPTFFKNQEDEMYLTSSAFHSMEKIPRLYSGEGEDISPPLSWSDLPEGTASLALLCEDPDAPRAAGQEHPFVHWLVFNFSPSAGSIPEGMPHGSRITSPISCLQGVNSFGNAGYNGPLPPRRHGPHRYLFRLFALSKSLDLSGPVRKDDLIKEMEGLVLGSATLTGKYERGLKQRRAA